MNSMWVICGPLALHGFLPRVHNCQTPKILQSPSHTAHIYGSETHPTHLKPCLVPTPQCRNTSFILVSALRLAAYPAIFPLRGGPGGH